MADNQEELQLILRMRNEASGELRRFSGDLRGTAQAVGQARGQFQQFARQAAAIGVTFLSLRSAARLVREAVRDFADFEQGLIGIGKTTGIAGDDLADLGQEIRDLARHDLPIARQELLDVAQAAGQLGIESASDILAFTEVVGKMGVASDLAGEEAATALARMLNVMGEAPGEVKRLASVIVELGNNAAASEAEIADVAQRIAIGTARFQIGTTAAAAYGTALAEIGLRAESAGSSLARTFTALDQASRPGGKGQDIVTSITGLSAREFRALFERDAAEGFDRFVSGLSRFSRDGGNAVAALKAIGLAGVEDTSIILALANNIERLTHVRKLASEEARKGTALDREAGEAFKALNAESDLLFNALEDLSTTIGERLAPTVREIIGLFTDAANASNDWLQDVFEIADAINQSEANAGKLFNAARIEADIEQATAGIAVLQQKIAELRDPELVTGVIDPALAVAEYEARIARLQQRIAVLTAQRLALSGSGLPQRGGPPPARIAPETPPAAADGGVLGELGDVLSDDQLSKLQQAKDRVQDIRNAVADFREQLALLRQGDAAGAERVGFLRQATDLLQEAGDDIGIDADDLAELIAQRQRLQESFETIAKARSAETQEIDALLDKLIEEENTREKRIADLNVDTETTRRMIAVQRLEADMREVAIAVIQAEGEARKSNRSLTDEEREAIRENVAAMQALRDDALSFEAGWQSVMEEFAAQAKDHASIVRDSFSALWDGADFALDRFVETGKFRFADFARSVLVDLAKIQLRMQATQLFGSLFGSILGLIPSGSPAGGSGPSIASVAIHGRAMGGAVRAGRPVIVGEEGTRELFIPDRDGQIVPLGKGSPNAAGIGGSTVNVTNNITVQSQGGNSDTDAARRMGEEVARAVDTKVRDVLRQEMRPGGMLRPV